MRVRRHNIATCTQVIRARIRKAHSLAATCWNNDMILRTIHVHAHNLSQKSNLEKQIDSGQIIRYQAEIETYQDQM